MSPAERKIYDKDITHRDATCFRPGTCGAVRPFGAILPTPPTPYQPEIGRDPVPTPHQPEIGGDPVPTPHQSRIAGGPVWEAGAPSAHTAADGHAARRPLTEAREGRLACSDCHEMKKQLCVFILWQDFVNFRPKRCHEMENLLHFSFHGKDGGAGGFELSCSDGTGVVGKGINRGEAEFNVEGMTRSKTRMARKNEADSDDSSQPRHRLYVNAIVLAIAFD